jgi:hypothetical protein
MSALSESSHRMDPPARTAPDDESVKPESVITPILLDIVIPLGIYYLLHDGFGMSLVTSMACSSILPAIRTISVAVRDHTLETLAALMLTLNVSTIVVSLISGDARLLFAREAAISSVVGLWALGTVLLRRTPLFEPGLEAFATHGERRRTQIWQRMHTCNPEFLTLVRRHTLVWGIVLLADSCARVVLSMTMPVHDLPWLSTAVTMGSIAFAVIASGVAAGVRLMRMFERECV